MGTISKALELLNFFRPDRSEIGLSEFVRLSGRDKATVHRHLTELEENGFLEQHTVSRAYRLGPALLRLSAVREAGFPLRKLLRPIVTDLSETVGELAHASQLQGNFLSSVFHADPKVHGTQVYFDESEFLPLHATSSGLAYLAFTSDEKREQILSGKLERYTEKTITDPEVLRTMLTEIRRRGLARLDQAFDEEVTSLGAPLFGADNRIIGALSVAVPSVRAKPEKLATIEKELRDAAILATQSLSGSHREFSQPMPKKAAAG